MVVRPAAPEDERALAVLDTASWPPELQVVPPRPADQPFFFPAREVRDVLVAVRDDVVLGYLHLSRHLPVPSNAHVLHVNALVVAADARGRGVGGLLVAAGVEEVRRRGARKVGLRALSTNRRALALYERAGFAEEGRLRDEIRLPDGSFADDVWLGLLLT